MKLIRVYQHPFLDWISFKYGKCILGMTSNNRLRIRGIRNIPTQYIPMKRPVKHTEES